MKKHPIQVLVFGLSATIALALAVGVSAQTPSPSAPPPAATIPKAAPMTGHPMAGAAGLQPGGDMKAECQAMMAKHQEMQDKFAAMDATLDKLVEEMNAARTSKEADAMEKPMAAVLTELVAQRKASRAMRMEMQPRMMKHMGHHMDMDKHGAMGRMDCPMMKMGDTPEPLAREDKPKP